jgi:hypothetical protein
MNRVEKSFTRTSGWGEKSPQFWSPFATVSVTSGVPATRIVGK